MCGNRLEKVQGADSSSLFPPPLSRQYSQDVAACTVLVCRAQYSMPLKKLNFQCLQRNDRAMIDRSARLSLKTLPPPDPMSYLHCLAFWRKEGSAVMDMWNAPMEQLRQPLTYMLMESVGLGGPRWHGSSWQRETAESGSSRLSILMIVIPGDLVWDLPCVQQASYLEGGPTDVNVALYQDSASKLSWFWRRIFKTFYHIWFLAAILFNGTEPFEQIVNTLLIQKLSCCYRANFSSNRPKVWEEMSKIDFQDGRCGGCLGFSINSVLAILCLLGIPMLLIVSIQLDYSL